MFQKRIQKLQNPSKTQQSALKLLKPLEHENRIRQEKTLWDDIRGIPVKNPPIIRPPPPLKSTDLFKGGDSYNLFRAAGENFGDLGSKTL